MSWGCTRSASSSSSLALADAVVLQELTAAIQMKQEVLTVELRRRRFGIALLPAQ